MVVLGFKLPHGLKAKARRDGYSIVKYSKQPSYGLRKKNSPKIGKNHHKFGNIMQELKIAYRKLNNAQRQALKQRKKREGNTKSDWIQFIREYYRETSRLAIIEKRNVKNDYKHSSTSQPKRKSNKKTTKDIDFLASLHKCFQRPNQGLFKNSYNDINIFNRLGDFPP
jgi:hypothetical protein